MAAPAESMYMQSFVRKVPDRHSPVLPYIIELNEWQEKKKYRAGLFKGRKPEIEQSIYMD
jgi:hypothetical protein